MLIPAPTASLRFMIGIQLRWGCIQLRWGCIQLSLSCAMQSSSKWQHKDGPGNATEDSCAESMRAGTLCDKAHSTSSQLEAAQQDAHLPGSVVDSTAVIHGSAPAGFASSRGSAPGVSDNTPSCALFCTARKGFVTISAHWLLASGQTALVLHACSLTVRFYQGRRRSFPRRIKGNLRLCTSPAE